MKSAKQILSILAVLLLAQSAGATALDDYVAAPDSNYGYSVVNTIVESDYTVYVLDMNSQSWRSGGEVDRTIWQHWLTIIEPSAVVSNIGLLFIDGGDNGGSVPSSVDPDLLAVALGTSTVVAQLKMVPNQPLTFAGESSSRSEDEIIAYTYDKFLDGGDSNWPALLPMTKSAVLAMDTVTDYMSKAPGGAVDVNEFVISGASKRGWTTWLTAAVDSRVVGIGPAVIDVLNMKEQMRHHYSAYGFYSDAVHDYVDMNVFERFGTPRADELLQIVDPYQYRQRLTVPKLIVNSTGDQFFLPDSSQFYFGDLIGEKYLRYIPNTDHGLDDSAYESLLVFYQSILLGSPLPQFSWTVDANDGSITVQTINTPISVKLWQATNPSARDFRHETIGNAWADSNLVDQGGGSYVADVNESPAGWTAFFVELTFDSGAAIDYIFTTQVSVVPECLPFAYTFGFDPDGDVDIGDLAVLVSDWLGSEPSVDIAPLCGDGIVNFPDYSLLLSE